MIINNTIYIIHGDGDAGIASSDNDFFKAFRITALYLPYNESRIHTYVPAEARNLTVVASDEVLANTSFGWEEDNGIDGRFYLDVPSSFDRTTSTSLSYDNESDFLANGYILQNLSYSSDSLRLQNGSNIGSYDSPIVNLEESYAIRNARITLNGSDLDNVTIQISNDAGANWISAENGTKSNFSLNQTSFRFRLKFEGNISAGYDPNVTSLEVLIEHVPYVKKFTIHLSYEWTQEFDNSTATIDIQETYDYSPNGYIVFMFYAKKGFSVHSNGIQLSKSNATGIFDYPDKDLYVFMAETFNGTPFSIELSQIEIEHPGISSDILLLILSITLILAAILILQSRKGRKLRPSEGTHDDIVNNAIDEETEAEESIHPKNRKKELIAQKKKIQERMDEIKKQQNSGDMDSATANAQMTTLKNEFKKVRNELNKISRKEKSLESQQAGESEDLYEIDEYEFSINLIAKLDKDFENGKLPEKTYNEMRKKYLTKAAALKAEKMNSSESEKRIELEAEKEKLMDAIVSLEGELKEGAIDETVYEELKNSYRNELIAIMKRLSE